MEVSADLLGDFLHTIYEGFDTSDEIEPKMWRALQRTMNEAAAEGLARGEYQPRHNDRFLDAMRHGNEVFAAFKVHAMGKAMADKLCDANGNIKPFEQWSNDVRTIASHHTGAWLRTEYNTAVLRAHAAADWQEFVENRDIFPNLRWMPTTSPDAEASHRSYWEKKLTLPIEHPFWEKHHPQDRWNCKCMLEATDDPATPADVVEDMPAPQPQRGLDNNPGKDGHLINDTHPYFPQSCAKCPFHKPKGIGAKLRTVFSNQKKDCFNCRYIDKVLPTDHKGSITKYDKKEWEYTYTSKNGFVVTQKERVKESEKSPQEKEKYEKEKNMCKVIADNGHIVEHLSDKKESGQTYDITIDGTPADLKCITGGAGNIVKYATKALRKQGGKAVVFQIPSHAQEYYKAFNDAKNKLEHEGKIYFYIAEEMILKEIK